MSYIQSFVQDAFEVLVWVVYLSVCVLLRLNSLKLKESIYYFNNNIWYKCTSLTWQKDKYLMADKKITNTKKTEDWDAQTTKNPDWHELRCSKAKGLVATNSS
jgi:hypothetical protein